MDNETQTIYLIAAYDFQGREFMSGVFSTREKATESLRQRAMINPIIKNYGGYIREYTLDVPDEKGAAHGK